MSKKATLYPPFLSLDGQKSSGLLSVASATINNPPTTRPPKGPLLLSPKSPLTAKTFDKRAQVLAQDILILGHLVHPKIEDAKTQSALLSICVALAAKVNNLAENYRTMAEDSEKFSKLMTTKSFWKQITPSVRENLRNSTIIDVMAKIK